MWTGRVGFSGVKPRGKTNVVQASGGHDGISDAIADCVGDLTIKEKPTEQKANWLKWWWEARNASAVQVLLAMVPESDINAQDKRGQTKLMWAADNKDLEVLQALVKLGADINMSTKKGTTAALLAVWPGPLDKKSQNAECLKRLAENGADLGVRDSQFGFTLPMWAVENDDMASLRVLVDAGADVSVRVFGSTAIDMAREAGNQEASLILQAAKDGIS